MSLVAVSCAERHVARLIQVNLERQGYQIVIWGSAAETLEQIESSSPNILVIDPDGTCGRLEEVISEARSLSPGTKIIVLRRKDSDHDDDGDADLYLTKPFDPMQILGGGGPPPAYA